MGKQKKLTNEELQDKLRRLNAWDLEDNKKLTKDFSFKNFKQALQFTNQVGELAEKLSHHPDIYLTWGKVSLTIQTHETDTLTDNDFELAQGIDEITAVD